MDDRTAVAVHGGVELQAAGSEERLAPAGAVTNHADLAVAPGQATQVLRRASHIADYLLVRHTALGTGRCSSIVGADSW